ncbi:MAG TPA: hypothetical protein QGF52_04555 [Nitrososphaerales archaeon]|nr:hypothetical protein [Nitrososphaerales archaeon]
MSKTKAKPIKKPKFTVYTIEVCPSCDFKTKRPFAPGDYVFQESAECSHCKKAKSRIKMIYAEPIKKS